MLYRFILVGFLTSFVACGPRDNNNNTSQKTQEAVIEVGEDVQTETAYDFLIDANMNTEIQIALSRAAEYKSNTPEVKALGQQVAIENRNIQNNILQLSEAVGIDMAPALSVEYLGLLDSIQSLNGQQFDEAYLNAVIEGHQEDIDQFTQLAEKTEDPITRNLVTQNLEILRRNLEYAQQTQALLQEQN